MNRIALKKTFIFIILCLLVIFNDFFNTEIEYSFENYYAHIISYIVALIICIGPFLILEFVIYEKYKSELPKIYKNFEHRWEIFGWIRLISNVVVSLYLMVNASILFLKLMFFLNIYKGEYDFNTRVEVARINYSTYLKEPNFGQGFNFYLFALLFIICIFMMLAMKKYSIKIFFNIGIYLMAVFFSIIPVMLFIKFISRDGNAFEKSNLLSDILLLFTKEGLNVWFYSIKNAFTNIVVVFSIFTFIDRPDIRKNKILKDVAKVIITLILAEIFLHRLLLTSAEFLIFKGHNIQDLDVGKICLLVINYVFKNKIFINLIIVIIIFSIILSKFLIALVILKTFVVAILEKFNIFEYELINNLTKFGIFLSWIMSSVIGYKTILPIATKYTYNYLILTSILVEMIYVGKVFVNTDLLNDIIKNEKFRKILNYMTAYIVPLILVVVVFYLAKEEVELLKIIEYNRAQFETIFGMILISFVLICSMVINKKVWDKKYKV